MSVRRGGASVLVMLLCACSTTVVDTADTTDTTDTNADVASTTATISRTAAERLSAMSDLVLGLSDDIVDGDRRGAYDEIVSLWAATAEEVGANEPEIRFEMDHQIDLLETAVDRRRPGTAVKVASNVAALVATYLERHG